MIMKKILNPSSGAFSSSTDVAGTRVKFGDAITLPSAKKAYNVSLRDTSESYSAITVSPSGISYGNRTVYTADLPAIIGVNGLAFPTYPSEITELSVDVKTNYSTEYGFGGLGVQQADDNFGFQMITHGKNAMSGSRFAACLHRNVGSLTGLVLRRTGSDHLSVHGNFYRFLSDEYRPAAPRRHALSAPISLQDRRGDGRRHENATHRPVCRQHHRGDHSGHHP